VKTGVNVHALASQCTVLQSACFLSCQRFHELPWPAVGLEKNALTASTSSVFPAEVDVSQSAHETF